MELLTSLRFFSMLVIVWAPFVGAAETTQKTGYEIKLYNGGWSLPLQDYNVRLITAALDVSSDSYGPYTLELYPDELSLERADAMLGEGVEVNCRMDSFRVDLSKGSKYQSIALPSQVNIVGLRAMIVKQSELAKFSVLNTVEGFLTLKPGQGEDWPDVAVYEHHGITVGKANSFDLIMPMLNHGRFDYIPLSIMEAYQFLEGYRDGKHGLSIVPNHYIFYSMPFYLAYPSTRPEIAERISFGIEQLYKSGALQAINEAQLAQMQPRFDATSKIFVLDNPFLERSKNEEIYRYASEEYFSNGAVIYRIPTI
ncbi:MAG: hypothetical protein ACI93R_000858 [Flavobacteriales bacterium]|jgi:hypothetical protein